MAPLLFLIFINELPDIVKHPEDDPEAPGKESSIVVFADDNSPTTSHENATVLQDIIQKDAEVVTEWFAKNDISCSGEKTKLLFIGTRARRQIQVENVNFVPTVNVCGDTISESTSEKILGVIVNNTITWKNHLYGDNDNIGLMKSLSKRIGMLKTIRKYVPNQKFSQIISGIFTSKLMYCSSVWGGVWSIPGAMDMDSTTTRTSISKDDVRKLQVLQNKTMRLETNLDFGTPTKELLAKTGKLSVHQMIAYSTAVQMYNIKRTEEPKYHHDRLFSGANRVEFKLSLARASFFYQGARIWAALPGTMKTAPKVGNFKKLCKQWIKSNIHVKP